MTKGVNVVVHGLEVASVGNCDIVAVWKVCRISFNIYYKTERLATESTAVQV